MRYNSGRHAWTTGRELAAALEQQIAAWPVPLQGLAMVGHGLGGLVLRSALHQAVRADLAWPMLLQKVVFLGTPHAGAHPGRALDLLVAGGLGMQAPLALARLSSHRSEGITDFLLGRWLEQDQPGAPASPMPDPWPPGASAYAIAGTVGDGLDDGLVPVASALGRDLVRDTTCSCPKRTAGSPPASTMPGCCTARTCCAPCASGWRSEAGAAHRAVRKTLTRTAPAVVANWRAICGKCLP